MPARRVAFRMLEEVASVENLAYAADQRADVGAPAAIAVEVQHCCMQQPLQADVVRRADRQIGDPLTATLGVKKIVRNVNRGVTVPAIAPLWRREVTADPYRLHGAIQHPGTQRSEPPRRHKLVVCAFHPNRSSTWQKTD